MANTTFIGPVRSENGFQTISKDATTGAITTTMSIGATAGVVIMTGLPTADPHVVGQLWTDVGGVLTVSAG